jgi:hypothetical protein
MTVETSEPFEREASSNRSSAKRRSRLRRSTSSFWLYRRKNIVSTETGEEEGKEATHRLDPVQLESTPVPFPDHIRQFQVLRLHIPLHPLHPIDRLLRRVSLELHLLVLAEHLEVFVSELRVELGEGFVLVAPEGDLLLEGLEHAVFRGELLLNREGNVLEFAFECFDALLSGEGQSRRAQKERRMEEKDVQHRTARASSDPSPTAPSSPKSPSQAPQSSPASLRQSAVPSTASPTAPAPPSPCSAAPAAASQTPYPSLPAPP